MQVNVRILQICCQFMADPKARLWSYGIARKLEMDDRTVAFALARLERNGWLASEWERVDHVGWRPRRKLYRLTELGRKQTTESLACLKISVSG